MIEMPLNYEYFVRKAFTFGTGESVSRYGDPASLAHTDAFEDSNIASVKVAVGYAMAIMRNAVKGVPDDESKRLDSFIEDVIDALGIRAINRLITDFQDTVVKQYFISQDGSIKLKP